MSEDDVRPVTKVARRTLIAGAAWVVPTVAVLSATPAFAASNSQVVTSAVNLYYTDFGCSRSQQWVSLDHAPWGYQAFAATVGNAGIGLSYHSPEVSVSSITATITVPKAGMLADKTKVEILSGSRATWTCTSATVSGANVVYTFSWTGGPLLSTAGDRYAPLHFSLPGDNSPSADLAWPKNISIFVSASGVNSATSDYALS